MELLAQDFHFKNSSIYGNVLKQDPSTNVYYTDLEQQELSIRVFGTQKQIDDAVDEYMNGTSLMLDECYNYKVEPVGSYWYNIMLPNADEQNERIAKKLKEYKKIYLEKKKPLIIGLR
jgi:hypothetical protein